MNLDNSEQIEEMDPQGMVEDLDTFPDQCREAVSIGEEIRLPFDLEKFDRALVTGMGGSAIVGDLLSRLLDFPVETNRGYHLPKTARPDDLLIAVSYSGNTEETLSALRDGQRRGMRSLCLSTGGKMESYCSRRSVSLVKIPTGHQPRASTGYMLFPLLKLFDEAGLAGTIDFPRLLDEIEGMTDSWNSSVPTERNEPKKLAEAFAGKVPIIYGTKGNTRVVAYRWKTQINENAKQPAFWNVFPELNHNETVGYQLGSELMDNGKVVMLKNGLDLEKNELRMEIMEDIFRDEGIDYGLARAPKGDKFSKVIGQVYFGDYFSVYLALLNEVDPSPVKLIENFKSRLKKKG
ncbi:bifunctional phosphoglucose/phosphomannose isomerase [Candidatus Bipolaricaulota bacterium]|nr:bifunctional phosphoglucose/phosphomannose isomerase [Candidatus Bipolaricaulota bacterium]